jgi:acyl carrier protein
MSTPSREQILEEVTARAAEAAYVDPEDVRPATRFAEDLSIDSLAGLSLLMKLEEEYGVRVTDAEARELLTVGDAVDLIAAKLSAS